MTKTSQTTEPAHHIAIIQETAIRRSWHNEEWWFSVVDVCAILTESPDAGAYWRKLKQRLNAEGSQPVTFCHGLKLTAADGRQCVTDCANTEGLFRIIQSIPSPKAEPFKRWLAQVGYERVKEIENPELASARARELYQAKGYPQAWIEKRLRSITVHPGPGWLWRGVAGAGHGAGQSPCCYQILDRCQPRKGQGISAGEHRERSLVSRLAQHRRNMGLRHSGSWKAAVDGRA